MSIWALLVSSCFSLAAPARLSLRQYLNQVQANNPEAQAAIRGAEAASKELHEADLELSPQAFINYDRLDDKKQNAQPEIEGDRLQNSSWQFGVRQKTTWGLSGDLYFKGARTNLHGAAPLYLPLNDYMESKAVLELRQSLWRNGFGEQTRSEIAAQRASAKMDLLRQKFALKTLLLKARNTYWAVVSFNQIVKLQNENAERARRLSAWMKKRARLKLYDDVEALQTEASLESRQMELEASRDQRASLIRDLNTLRGQDSDVIGALDDLPTKDMMAKARDEKPEKMWREDFQMIRAQGKMEMEQARAARSKLLPQLDVHALLASNGREGLTEASYQDVEKGEHPTWEVGVEFSVPLDIGLLHSLRGGYEAAMDSARDQIQQADFQEQRMWKDLIQRRAEAQNRFERAEKLEDLQTRLVARERKRLLNGRTTTFEELNMEQSLALAQVARVKAQLDLLQAHNVLKTFSAGVAR